jgi:hypothetical protein
MRWPSCRRTPTTLAANWWCGSAMRCRASGDSGARSSARAKGAAVSSRPWLARTGAREKLARCCPLRHTRAGRPPLASRPGFSMPLLSELWRSSQSHSLVAVGLISAGERRLVRQPGRWMSHVPGSAPALDDLWRAGVQVRRTGEVPDATGHRGPDVAAEKGRHAAHDARADPPAPRARSTGAVLRGLGLVQRQEGERERRVVVRGGPQAPRRRSGCSAGWSIFHLPPSQSDMRRRRPYKIEWEMHVSRFIVRLQPTDEGDVEVVGPVEAAFAAGRSSRRVSAEAPGNGRSQP